MQAKSDIASGRALDYILIAILRGEINVSCGNEALGAVMNLGGCISELTLLPLLFADTAAAAKKDIFQNKNILDRRQKAVYRLVTAPKSGIPEIHIEIWTPSATLIGQLSIVTLFGAFVRCYITHRLLMRAPSLDHFPGC